MRLPESRRRAVVWDLDGTLVDSAADICEALNSVLSRHGRRTLREDEARPMIGNGVARLLESGFSATGPAPGPEEGSTLVLEFLEAYRQAPTSSTRPYPGVVEALEHFRSSGARQGVCTNKPVALSWRILVDLGLAGFFGSVVGGDSTDQRKPHPLPLTTCLAELGCAAADSLMVGDSAVDVGAARAAGLTVAVVDWGYGQDGTKHLHADYRVSDAAGLLSMSVVMAR